MGLKSVIAEVVSGFEKPKRPLKQKNEAFADGKSVEKFVDWDVAKMQRDNDQVAGDPLYDAEGFMLDDSIYLGGKDYVISTKSGLYVSINGSGKEIKNSWLRDIGIKVEAAIQKLAYMKAKPILEAKLDYDGVEKHMKDNNIKVGDQLVDQNGKRREGTVYLGQAMYAVATNTGGVWVYSHDLDGQTGTYFSPTQYAAFKKTKF
jgi:hypothetical protein